MRLLLGSLLLFISFNVQAAQITTLKKLSCSNNQFDLTIEIVKEPGRPVTVQWHAYNQPVDESSFNVAYLDSSNQDLTVFSSKDFESSLTVNGKNALLTDGAYQQKFSNCVEVSR